MRKALLVKHGGVSFSAPLQSPGLQPPGPAGSTRHVMRRPTQLDPGASTHDSNPRALLCAEEPDGHFFFESSYSRCKVCILPLMNSHAAPGDLACVMAAAELGDCPSL